MPFVTRINICWRLSEHCANLSSSRNNLSREKRSDAFNPRTRSRHAPCLPPGIWTTTFHHYGLLTAVRALQTEASEPWILPPRSQARQGCLLLHSVTAAPNISAWRLAPSAQLSARRVRGKCSKGEVLVPVRRSRRVRRRCWEYGAVAVFSSRTRGLKTWNEMKRQRSAPKFISKQSLVLK